ncbi:MAG: hypothetical protein EBZ48_02165 [Proteobacteria bacterium]|nr:hypothetical protein [Pseudomonadota bacterium]
MKILEASRQLLAYAIVLLFVYLPRAWSYASASEVGALVVTLPGTQHSITFRRLPKIADAIPVASLGPADALPGDVAPAYEVPSVYLAEKELTLYELRALVSEKTWSDYKKRILEFTGTDDDPKFGGYRKAVREASDKFPAILVDLATILEACGTLDKLAEETPAALSLESDVATVSFRLPSRVEWQYAARGTQDAAEAKTRGRFPEWPQFDTGEKGRWSELCNKAGKDPSRFPTPEAICEVADSLLTEKKSKDGYEFLGEVLKKALKFEVNVFRTSEQRILPVQSVSESEWGFHRLLGNASEWTVDGKSLEDVEALWNSLKQADANALSKDTRAIGVIMGGQFLNTVPQPGCWMKFSIADGHTKEGNAFSVQDAYGRTANGEDLDDFVGLKAGVRLCVRRSISPRWFISFRRTACKGHDLEKATQECRESFRDLCVVSEFEKLAKVLDAYARVPLPAEVSDDEARLTSFTTSMIAAALAFTDKAVDTGGRESAADEAIRQLQALGIGGGGGRTNAGDGNDNRSGQEAQRKRDRSSTPKPNFFDVLSSVNRS